MMLEAIGSAAMLEQLPEESAELEQAALMVARILMCDNPTTGTLKYSPCLRRYLSRYTANAPINPQPTWA